MTDPLDPSAIDPAPVDPAPVDLTPIDPAAEKAAVLADWSAQLSAALGLSISVDIDDMLALAGVAAHTVIRPAAPLTTFLVGYAAGRAAAEFDPDTDPTSNAESAIAQAMESARALLRAAGSGTALR